MSTQPALNLEPGDQIQDFNQWWSIVEHRLNIEDFKVTLWLKTETLSAMVRYHPSRRLEYRPAN